MTRYIDADRFERVLLSMGEDNICNECCMSVIEKLDAQPTFEDIPPIDWKKRMRKVKGYKGMNADMTCRGMKYEVGKTYYAYDAVEVCSNGLHFCERLADVFDYYPRNETNRFFEVEAEGVVETDGKKSATNKLVITRELEAIEINRTAYGYGDGDGYGYGYGDGNGYGDGYGYSDGNGYGDGNGYDDGCGGGNGYGDGNIQRILLFI